MSLVVDVTSGSDPSKATSSMKGLFTMLKPSLPTLGEISIDYATKDDDETYGSTLAGLCHEFEKMTGQNVVETIDLAVWVPSDYDYTGWEELDDVLLGSPDGWPALRKVSLLFGIASDLTSDSEDDDLDKTVPKLPNMTKLVESKRVLFDIKITE